MKRRAFLGMAGIAAGFGLPLIGAANQRRAINGEENSFSSTVASNQLPEAWRSPQAAIKVIGVGGAGCDAVQHMIQSEMPGIEFICTDTDSQALRLSYAQTKILVEHEPERTSALLPEHQERIAEAIKGADMVFITAGMGGNTGRAMSSMVAELARSLSILTVGMVSMPFSFEGRRVRTAELGLAELSGRVDAHTVIDLDLLAGMFGEDVSMAEAFGFANSHIRNAIGGITGIFTTPGLWNLDFEDVQKSLSGMGKATMGFGTAKGANRAIIAAENAMLHPLMKSGNEMRPLKQVLFNMTASRHIPPNEVVQVIHTIQQHASAETTVLGGAVYDESMGEQMRVTVFAG